MQFRSTAAAIASAVIVLGAAGCTSTRQVSDVPDDDRPTPETTPFLEPVSPPANPSNGDGGEVSESDDQ